MRGMEVVRLRTDLDDSNATARVVQVEANLREQNSDDFHFRKKNVKILCTKSNFSFLRYLCFPDNKNIPRESRSMSPGATFATVSCTQFVGRCKKQVSL